MKKNRIKTFVLVMLCCTTTAALAQTGPRWTVGVKGGITRTAIDQSNLGRTDETYSACNSWDFGIQAKYAFTDWFAIRADFGAMNRSYRMDRNLHYLDPVFTEHRNNYLMLPVMADFSFGGTTLRGHAYCGGYGAYWTNAHVEGKTYWMTDYYLYFNDFNENRSFNSEDQRLIAGAVGGLGLSYAFLSMPGMNMALSVDALYYYDLVSHHKGYANLSDPRYLNTLSITMGILVSF